ncbi:septal ring lytic transglycosylase RlpA family protein [Reyranella sp.]|uniref:septal ring lytic transglycosylase RlpA family protein n=1 Tax=Reyranella sp. TaxID=1929291 RepID=UPI0025F74CF9|nr:septal ring lytic transglycosylase RlpA family protein [Reyranella sp.]
MALVRACGAILIIACLGACGSTSGGKGSAGTAQRGAYKVGAPYKIDGVWYTPKEEFNHVETGVASWYGPGFHGKSTANGERYDQADRTAAHRTLQMPSIVRVTNLSNGQSTVVRINDRGPFASNRVIDLSRTAAQELDIIRNGTARVRIEQLQAESLAVKEVAINGGGPAEQHEAVAQLASGRRAPQPPQQVMATAQPAAAPPSTQVQAGWPANPRSPAIAQEQTTAAPGKSGPTIASLASTLPTPSGGGFYVQTGSFSTAENAERQRGAVRSYGSSEISQASASGRDVYRVRLGPYTTSDAAGIVADRLKRSGYGEARVVGD